MDRRLFGLTPEPRAARPARQVIIEARKQARRELVRRKPAARAA